MYRRSLAGFIGFLSVAATSASVFAGAPTWPEATQESKPWVYNWWMGSAVDEKGLEAQCSAHGRVGAIFEDGLHRRHKCRFRLSCGDVEWSI